MIKLRIPRLGSVAILRRAALGYMIVWVLSPPLAYGTAWRVLAILAMGAWLLLDMRGGRSVILRPSWPVFGGLLFAIYTGLVEWLGADAPDINRHFQVWVMLFFLLVGESIPRNKCKDATFAFWLALFLLPIWSITTIHAMDTLGANVARAVVRSSVEAMQLTKQGVGGFGFIYTLVLCMPFLIGYVTTSGRFREMLQGGWRTRICTGLVIVNIALGCLLILRAGYSIAVLLTVLAIAFILLIRNRNPLKLTLAVIFSGFLAIGGSMVLQATLKGLETSVEGTKYSAKISDVRSSLREDQSIGTVEDRTERYERSFWLAISNPVLGTLSYGEVGKHSAFLDRFAEYGSVIGFLFFSLMAYLPWRALRNSAMPIGTGLAFLVVGIGFPLMNPVFMSWGMALFVFSRGAMLVMDIPLRAPGNAQARASIVERRFAHD